MGGTVCTFFLIQAVLSAVYIVFSILFTTNLRVLFKTVDTAYVGVNTTLSSAKFSIENVGGNIDQMASNIKDWIVPPVQNLCDDVAGISDPISLAVSILESIKKNQVSNIVNKTQELNNLFQEINNMITFDKGNVGSVDTTQLDDTSNNLNTKLADAITSLDDIVSQSSGAGSACKDGVKSATTFLATLSNSSMGAQISGITSGVVKQLDSISSMISGPAPQKYISDAVFYANIADAVRIGLELFIVVAPLFVYLLICAGTYFKSPMSIKFGTCLTCSMFWLLFIVASLQAGFWILTRDICTNVPERLEPIVNKVVNMTLKTDPLAGMGTTIPEAITNVATCKEGANLITAVFGDITSLLQQFDIAKYANSSIIDAIGQFDIKDSTTQVIDTINSQQSSMSLGSLSFNISTFTGPYEDVKNKLNEVKLKAESDLDQAIQNVNDPSLTIETLNSTCYNSGSYSPTTDPCLTLLQLLDDFSQASLQYNRTRVAFKKCDGIVEDIAADIEFINLAAEQNVVTLPDQLKMRVGNVASNFTTLVSTITTQAPTMIISEITKVLDSIADGLPCRFIRVVVNDVSDHFCDGMVKDSGIVSLFAILTGFCISINVILLFLLDKYVTYRLKGVATNSKQVTKKEKKKSKKELKALGLNQPTQELHTYDMDNTQGHFRY